MKKIAVYDSGFKQLIKLVKQLNPKNQKVTSIQTQLPLGYASSTPTPDNVGGGGSTGASVTYQWLNIPVAYISSVGGITIGVSGDDVDLSTDIYNGALFDSSNPERIQLFVNGNLINQGASGSYPRWEVGDANTLILSNLDIAGPKGAYSGTVIIVRKTI